MPVRMIYPQEHPAKKWAKRVTPYTIAVLISVVATWATLLIPAVATKPFYVLLLFGTGVCAWRYGLGPSWISAGLNSLAVTYLVLPPQWSFRHKNPDDLIRLAVFSILSLVLGLADRQT